ncbi:DMT family transporter [Levilactobacillus spicheri]|uniref:Quaternary ammonium transporter n=1 Tax=Levilactobacillus spicheri TaxID=216463 RepID=A0A0F3RQ68_9LACO|nr:multidrug efflux SMR transporter [Levilactobacillus spicheri]KJW12173.1 quaternary ammonium transporter [Levilactobacillus spicheri]
MGYVYLSVSIITELVGTTMLKASNGFTRLGPTMTSLIAYTICFYFLSLTLRTVNMSVAYALWGGIGIVLTTAVAVIFMHAPLNFASVCGIFLILVGSLVLNLYGAGGH